MSELMVIGSDLVTWVQAHPVISGAAGGLTLGLMAIPPMACWWLLRRSLAASRAGAHQIEHRLSHLCSAVELLTDTTESGLQSASTEIQRLLNNDINRLSAQPGLEMRVQRAAHDGRSIRQIAQREGVSEGEVHLRMMLNKPAWLRQATPVTQ